MAVIIKWAPTSPSESNRAVKVSLKSLKNCFTWETDSCMLMDAITKLQGGYPKERVVAVDVADTQAQNLVAAKKLRGIEKIVESVWCDIIIC